jgi:hypothetical protein
MAKANKKKKKEKKKKLNLKPQQSKLFLLGEQLADARTALKVGLSCATAKLNLKA